MIILDSTLKSAQDSLIRAPICRVNSSSFVDAIPFDGNYFNTSPTAEQYPYLIETSSGRLAMVLSVGTTLVYRYSDTGKIQFTDVILLTGSASMYEAALVEIISGVIGIIFSDRYQNNIRLRSFKIDETGQIITSPSTIQFYASEDYHVREVCVIKLSTSGYLCVYRKTVIDTTEQFLMQRTSSDFITWSSESIVGI